MFTPIRILDSTRTDTKLTDHYADSVPGARSTMKLRSTLARLGAVGSYCKIGFRPIVTIEEVLRCGQKRVCGPVCFKFRFSDSDQ